MLFDGKDNNMLFAFFALPRQCRIWRPLYISEPPDQNTKGVEVMEELAVARVLLSGIDEAEKNTLSDLQIDCRSILKNQGYLNF